MKHEEWEELIRSDLLPYNVCVPMHSILHSNRFIGGPKYRKILLYVKDRMSRYYENFADHHIVGDFVLKRFLDSQEAMKKYLEEWKEDFDDFNALIAEIRQLDIPSLSLSEIAQKIRELYIRSIEWHGTAYNVDAIDTVLNPLLQELIDELYPDKKKSERAAIYNKLAFPEVLSYANRMNLDKLKLFKEVLEKGKGACAAKIAVFIESYYWVDFQWGESKEYTKETFNEELSQFTAEKIDEELHKIETRIAQSLDKKHKVMKEIAEKKPLITTYIKIFDEYAVLHDWRKEGQVKASCYLRALYGEIAKRQDIPENLLWYAWPEELAEKIEKEETIDTALLERRSKEWFCEFKDDGAYQEVFGKEALQQRDAALGLDKSDYAKELKGIGVSEGRITGPARVCLSPNDALERVEEGDILVTGMTMPDFIPAMERAAAIVTDEGGLTCHAAIIARELGKPCVVGTKLATRLITDNDLLEVNANHGVVKIIK